LAALLASCSSETGASNFIIIEKEGTPVRLTPGTRALVKGQLAKSSNGRFAIAVEGGKKTKPLCFLLSGLRTRWWSLESWKASSAANSGRMVAVKGRFLGFARVKFLSGSVGRCELEMAFEEFAPIERVR
jgi:hypothetical protein